MSDRIRRADKPMSLSELIVGTTRHGDNETNASGSTLAILASSNRVVLKSGRVSGARACALSARAAARGIQTRAPKV